MPIQDWAAIGEIISAMAVVVSLLYVGMQVRGNTREIRAARILAYLAQPPAHEIYRQDKLKGILHADFVRWLDSVIRARQTE